MTNAPADMSGDTVGARPLVAGQPSNRGVWLFAGVAAVGAISLFAVLEARRAERSVDALAPVQLAGEGMIAPPPDLVIPEIAAQEPGYPAAPTAPVANQQVAVPQPLPVPASVLRPARMQGYAEAPPAYSSAPLPAPVYVPPQPSGPATVFQAPAIAPGTVPAAGSDSQRVKAGHFANPSLTIPKGAVIQAVLETAVDSTRPGPARALVSRDVRSFDGTRILVPRGSRLYGEYKADLASGQNRAMIQWTRLMRPDGVIIALDSPSGDPLGRAGVKGKVNSHFFARFGNALLQTLLNAGVSYTANQATGGTVILGLPGSTVTSAVPQAEAIRPTLKVAQGTPVSVFVARDLDFSEVER